MAKHHYKIIIAFLSIIIALILMPNPFSILAGFFAGAFAHSSDRDRQLLTKENK